MVFFLVVSLPLNFQIFFQTDFIEEWELIVETSLHEEALDCLIAFLKLMKFKRVGCLKYFLWALFLSRIACLHSSVNQGTLGMFFPQR